MKGYCANLNITVLVKLLLLGGAVRDFALGQQFKDIDVLVSIDREKCFRPPKDLHPDAQRTNFSLAYYVDAIVNSGLFDNCIVNEHYAGDLFFVVKAFPNKKFQDECSAFLNNDKKQIEHFDFLLVNTDDYRTYVDDNFDYGICKIFYDRSGIQMLNHFRFDNEMDTISINVDKFDKLQLVKFINVYRNSIHFIVKSKMI
jgi:hypothetical protein